MSSEEEMKARVTRGFDEWNKGYAAWEKWADTLYDANVLFHTIGGDKQGIKAYKQFCKEFFDAFPDVHLTFEGMVVEGNYTAVFSRLTGTHKGVFNGIPPTNKKATLTMMEFTRFVGGKVVEGWAVGDVLGLLQQLGIIPKGNF